MTSALGDEAFGPASQKGSFAGRAVMRSPEALTLHQALAELSWSDATEEIDDLARRRGEIASEPILITSQNTILAGIARWRLAVLEGTAEVYCIEYPISEEEQLQFILAYHKPRRGWNAFVRIRLALTLEATLQKRALDNMRQGGRNKGLANLPEPSRIDVRKQIAEMAAAGARNVSNVKVLLKTAHPRLLAALSEGTLTINRAMQLCALPPGQQLQQYILQSEDAATSQVIRRCLGGTEEASENTDVSAVLSLLRQQITNQSGSVVVRLSSSRQNIILLSRDLLKQLQESDTTP